MFLFAEKYKFFIIIGFFSTLLLIGMTVFADYGISYDELASKSRGGIYLKYIGSATEVFFNPTPSNTADFETIKETVANYKSRGHGAIFAMILFGVPHALGATDSKDIFLIRHFITFFYYWISLIAFFLLLRKLSFHWGFAIIGVLFLFLSPRIFAHSFYNMKDIAFLSSYIIAAYTCIVFLEKKNCLWAIVHALACAICIDIRIPGLIVPLITGLFFLIMEIKQGFKHINKRILMYCTYILCLLIFTIIFWPFLWEHPLNNFLYAFNRLSAFPAEVHMYFFGGVILSTELPWYYAPTWMAITTPILYICLFLLGVFHFMKCIISDVKNPFVLKHLFAFSFLFFPLLIVILKSSVLYNAWRHLFFIYPFFILISIIGLRFVYEYLKQVKKYVIVFSIFIFLNVSFITFKLYTNHPFQYVYFNALAGGDLMHRFDTDYWSLCYRQGLEYILEDMDNESTMVSSLYNVATRNNRLLDIDSRKKLYFTSLDQADYFLSTRGGYSSEEGLKLEDLSSFKEIYQINVDNIHILSVYKRKEK